MEQQTFRVEEPIDPRQPPKHDDATKPTQSQAVLGAVETHFFAKRARATANLNMYILNGVGVGEHPDIMSEVIKLFEEIDHAESVLVTLQRVTSQ